MVHLSVAMAEDDSVDNGSKLNNILSHCRSKFRETEAKHPELSANHAKRVHATTLTQDSDCVVTLPSQAVKSDSPKRRSSGSTSTRITVSPAESALCHALSRYKVVDTTRVVDGLGREGMLNSIDDLRRRVSCDILHFYDASILFETAGKIVAELKNLK